MDEPANITGCILAGGLGRRFDGVDKGLLPLAGRPLVAHVLARLRPQVDAVVISANRNLADYAALAVPVISDAHPAAYAGPLAGCLAALRATRSPWICTAACDSPFLPADLVTRLQQALTAGQADIAVVRSDGRLQPVFALFGRALAPSLEAFLAEGGRKVDAWFARHRVAEADFERDTAAFLNVNTPADLDRAARRLAAHA
ncbi:MAG: molybdenum cofactor guanylyltransferase [Gammaproteobacteria bacterium]|nr:molybdenum cofactor guanylyltransferase [Gammaproteobacteria bacterium]MCP5201973.1 molybdenum cofactor guanylyltransferase [Gammaproteobacteria bacterium]